MWRLIYVHFFNEGNVHEHVRHDLTYFRQQNEYRLFRSFFIHILFRKN